MSSSPKSLICFSNLSEEFISVVTPKSVGSNILEPSVESNIFLAIGTYDSSNNDFPILNPKAFKNVKHIPPPKSKLSTLGNKFSII